MRRRLLTASPALPLTPALTLALTLALILALTLPLTLALTLTLTLALTRTMASESGACWGALLAQSGGGGCTPLFVPGKRRHT